MNQKLAEHNFKYCEQTIKDKEALELDYLKLAQRLYKIFNDKMYEPNYDTFQEFLDEIKISQATASKLINIWTKFVLEFKIKPKLLAAAGGWSVVSEVLPYANSKKSALEWLVKARELKRRDLRKETTEAKTGIAMATCKHIDFEVITFYRCLRCGDTWQEPEAHDEQK